METNRHSIELRVNGQRMDTDSSFSLRINTTLTDPTKIQTKQTEYSFSFTLPPSGSNNKTLGYANTPSVVNKFNKRYPMEVYADGTLLFKGKLYLNGYDPKKGYKCNLYVNKSNTVEEIFSDTKMTEMEWPMEYDQQNTVNRQNALSDPQVFFPMAMYGLPQKVRSAQQMFISGQSTALNNTLDYEDYTPKDVLDDTAYYYNQNFLPSPNLLETLKRMFASKGYKLGGNILTDTFFQQIYLSTNIAEEQDFEYPWATDMGKAHIDFTFTNGTQNGTRNYFFSKRKMRFPAMGVQTIREDEPIYNFSHINDYNVFLQDSDWLTLTYDHNKDLMWRRNRFVVPTDGYYKIRMNINVQIPSWYTPFKINEHHIVQNGRDNVLQTTEVTPTNKLDRFNCVELQLLKNTDEYTDTMIAPINALNAAFHQNYPSDFNTAAHSAWPHTPLGSGERGEGKGGGGYMPQNYRTMCFDPGVNENFVCGVTACYPYMLTSVIKKADSWNAEWHVDDIPMARYESEPYYRNDLIYSSSSSSTTQGGNHRGSYKNTPTLSEDYGVNTLPNSTMEIRPSSTQADAFYSTVECIVYLKKNDYLQLHMVTRHLNNSAEGADTLYDEAPSDAVYKVVGNIDIEAWGKPRMGINNDYFDWDNPSQFPTLMNVASFFNQETRMADFIDNVIKAFNLQYTTDGKNVMLDTQKRTTDASTYAIDINKRVNTMEMTASEIDFPSSMQVKFSVDTDEEGFYLSVPHDRLDDVDWTEYGDYGSDKVELNLNEGAQPTEETTSFSYSWYKPFTVKVNGQNRDVSLPIIGKWEWWIPSYKYDEMMQKDGYSLPMRMWLKPNDGMSQTSLPYVYLNGYDEIKVYVYGATNSNEGTELSYKRGDTLLTRYFNLQYDNTTNYIELECYLTTEEYMMVKNGAHIRIDTDVYIPTEIQGYDPQGRNKAKIKAMKK